jgi:aryl-alcohol dehydrogenase-like predicted oxidoreductase
VSDHPAVAGIPWVIGGNAFGWTADRDTSFAVLDAFYEAGGQMIDTAEGYSNWVPGHVGGESETIIGAWLADRGVRDEMRLHTKVGMGGEPGCLSPDKVAAAIEGSLERLQTDRVDLYYAHRDDPQTPLREVAEGFAALVTAGRVRALGASNFSAERLAAALDAAEDLVPYSVVQPQYNLVERASFEGPLQDLCAARGLIAFPYYGLALGFLSGKYRSAADADKSVRGARAVAYLESKRGRDVLAALDAVAGRNGVTPGDVALAWMLTRPAVGAPIAGARTPEQVRELARFAELQLDDEDLARLEAASD